MPRAQTRASLLAAARDTFAARGYYGASVDQIVAAAGLTSGALYAQFPGKEGLYQAALDANLKAQREAHRTALADAPADLEQRMRDWAERWLLSVVQDPPSFLLLLQAGAQAAGEPELQPRLARALGDYRALLRGQIEAGAKDAGIALPADAADDLARVLLALAHGLALDNLVNPRTFPKELFGSAVSLIFRSLAVSARRRR